MLPGLVLLWALCGLEGAAPTPANPAPPTPQLAENRLFPGAAIVAGNTRLTFGGFADFVGIYREHFVSEDIATSFWNAPFPTRSAYYTPELRLSSRQSRLFLHAETVHAAAWQGQLHFEIDFLGAAVTSNSVQSNSFTPRMRHGYATVARDAGAFRLALLAGQTWSLLTMAGPGLELGTERPPAGLDAQFVPGFLWARQPQVRITARHARSGLTLAGSLENPQTTFLSAAPPGALTTVSGGFLLDPASNLSLSHVPDMIFKVAHDLAHARVRLHTELFGLARLFTVRSTERHNEHVWGGGVGGSAHLLIPSLKQLSVSLSGGYGEGMGRYGSTQFPDASLDARAIPHGKALSAALLGAEVDPHPRVRLFAFAGLEKVDAHNDLPTADVSGCLVTDGVCTGANGRIWSATGGAWVTLAESAPFRLRLGLQYAHIQRTLIGPAGLGPTTRQQQGYFGLRCEI